MAYTKSAEVVLRELKVDSSVGLTSIKRQENSRLFGKNILSKQKKKSLISKAFSLLKEPMMIILVISFIVAFGTGLGKFLKTGEMDFAESFGVLAAILLSVSITLIMEGSSEKAFSELNKIYDKITVKVIRDGGLQVINQSEVVVGDIIYLDSGDKIVADGRLIETNELSVNESALTGESDSVSKNANIVLDNDVPLAERINCVYSGTFVSSGSGKMIVTVVGDKTEIGNIAGALKEKEQIKSPLEQKLAKLGRIISIIGGVCAGLVFIVSIVKQIVMGTVTFSSVQELFISCIILLVAAVPEGLPTIVAVSLALNMIKLAKENALIKKMIATETTGAVSVICSDKTGTLTMNKMSVVGVCSSGLCFVNCDDLSDVLLQNCVCNNGAEVVKKGKRISFTGSGTECALLEFALKNKNVKDITSYRGKFALLSRVPFDSDKKFMQTQISVDGAIRGLIKGAPEKVLPLCNLTEIQKNIILNEIQAHQKQAKRVLALAHDDGNGYIFDAYVVFMDKIRPDVYLAVAQCKSAGIKIKMLTGDNSVTAYSIAKELGIAHLESEVITASEIENIDDESLKKLLSKVSVIARSTPSIKSRVVGLLKEMGEVVAVTGDGINDAPAIRKADVGIAMGKSGSEISKEASDIVLLDDSFSTIVKAISFGRNVYKNLQRFILFQLSVNLSALFFITVCAFLGVQSPFNTLQLLWINVIMDGPPALTLGLEKSDLTLMSAKPVQREKSIVSKNMLLKIIFNGIYVGGVILLEYFTDFLGAGSENLGSCVFTLFIMFQLFNAFNCRELGSESILKSLGKNKIMLFTFLFVFALQVLIVQFGYGLFGVTPMQLSLWVKIVCTALSVVIVSEIFKFTYRIFRHRKIFPKKVNKKVIGA